MSSKKILLLLCLGALVLLFFILGGERYLSIDWLRASQSRIEHWRAAQPLLAAAAYFLTYIFITSLSLPGAALLSLAGGAIFGLWQGLLLVSFASALGALLAFLLSRFLLRDWLTARFGHRLQAINDGIRSEGAFYLFTLRLAPIFPFFMINLLMGLTTMRARTFYWVSQLGMLAGCFVFVNAGTQLAQIENSGDIFSPALIISFTLLALFPLIAARIIAAARRKKLLASWPRPRRFDRNIIVIGGGSAGLVAAYIAAALKAKVTLVEKDRMGGDCLNSGCVPSKALIRVARFVSQLKHSEALGLGRVAAPDIPFAAVMERVHKVIEAVRPHDSIERYTKLGVEVMQGEARIISPWRVQIKREDGREEQLTTRTIIIAAGARPFAPPIPGLDDIAYLTSDNLWRLTRLPQRLLVLGGGPIGSELSLAFARLGARVMQVEMAPRILAREDPEVSQLAADSLRNAGVAVLVNHRAKQFLSDDGEKILIAEHAGEEVRIAFDEVLVAVGRVANMHGYGLEELGVSCARTVTTNAFMQTNFANIYAAGDVAGPWQFTHTAAHQAWYATVNALFDPVWKFRLDTAAIPRATFIDPEIACVGLNEQEAREQGVAHETSRFELADLDRAIADDAIEGFVKVLTAPGSDRILGVVIVGAHAAELIAEFVLAMRQGLGLNKVLAAIHIYPSMAEANKYAAGVWKKAHAPQRVLAWLQRFHAWRCG